MNQFQKIKREQTNSVKWDMMDKVYGRKDLLPMWVADMDFLAPKEVREKILDRANHGIFGYTFPSDRLFKVVRDWIGKRYGWDVSPSWMLPSNGVVPSISMAIQALTNVGDSVLIQTPVYTPFYDMIKNNDRKVVINPLIEENGYYSINFVDFENKLKEEDVKLFILCNPHNPVGRVWKKEELNMMAELCEKYGVYIVSDEIHADIVFSPHKHTPIASLDKKYEEISITCYAPSKTFNIAGLQASVMVIPNQQIRSKISEIQKKLGFFTLNVFGLIGMEAAYEYGEQWLENLLSYLKNNIETAIKYIKDELPFLHVKEPEGTYLLWIDCRSLNMSDQEIQKALVEKGKLALEAGKKYGVEGEGFVRMNIGCHEETLIDGLHRLKKAYSN